MSTVGYIATSDKFIGDGKLKRVIVKFPFGFFKIFPCFFFFIFILTNAHGQVKLPKLISDGMVLQRNVKLKIWGWSSPVEQIKLTFVDSTYLTAANEMGEWFIELKPFKEGGPYQMQISGKNNILITDILIGDVWVCSGQSNMEQQMRRVAPRYPAEIKTADNPLIRQFTVPQEYDFNEARKDLKSGEWKKVNPENIPNFSAVAYFFAKELYDKYKVPVGIINNALGGSPVEAWISEESLKKFPVHYQEAQKFKDSLLIKNIEQGDRARIQAWYALANQKDEGYKISGKNWYDPSLSIGDWANTTIPGYWNNTSLGAVNGVVWFRKEIQVPVSMIGKPAKLEMGRIVDADSIFIHGKFVGTTSYQYPPRWYNISSDILKEGKNIIAIRVINNSGNGGFVPDKPYELVCMGQTIDLKGEWKFKLGAIMPPLASQTFIRWKPLGLYNGMINPLINYRIKGVIWYQGESNVSRSEEYKELFPALIKDWRQNWNQGDFPFLFVQLANFLEPQKQPAESSWASLREAQLKTLSEINTGMAVAIDLGEWNDIHPLNKQDVGKRLAYEAYKIAYGENKNIPSSPLYKSMKIKRNKIIISFKNSEERLVAKGSGMLNYFSIAGEDKQFVWAKALIKNNKVIVWSDKVKKPVSVRYAWADNPEGANLYNIEGLPASPFRTDNW